MTEEQATSFIKSSINGNPASFRCVQCATQAELAEEQVLPGIAIPNQLREFLARVLNGIRFGDISILPVKSRTNLKKTANSLAHNNNLDRSIWLEGDLATFGQFMIFATDGCRGCFSFDRTQGDLSGVWYWVLGDEKVVELDYGFWQWFAETIGQECR